MQDKILKSKYHVFLLKKCTKIFCLQMAGYFNNYSEKNLEKLFSSDLSKPKVLGNVVLKEVKAKSFQ